MKKFFKMKLASTSPEQIQKLILGQVGLVNPLYGFYDVNDDDRAVSGFFWIRETVIVENELALNSPGQLLTIYKISRFAFSLRHIHEFDYLLTVESASRSVKPLVNILRDLTEENVFIGEIIISLADLVGRFESAGLRSLKITHAYALDHVISRTEKISFSIYSTENALNAANEILHKRDAINFERLKLEVFNDGELVKLDIKRNCSYSISELRPKVEKLLLDYILNFLRGSSSFLR